VGQFLFSSSNLIYKPTEPGTKINEDCPVQANWGYPESKIQTEELIKQNNKDIPAIFMRIAGVYNDYGHSIPITQQIKRIYEKELLGHFYSGDVHHGDVFVHLEDVIDAIEKAVEKRNKLPNEMAFNIGEPTTPTYQQLQDAIGNLLYQKDWETYELPKTLAKAGAWMRDLVGDPFIKPWMIDRAGAHYELDISRAEKYLDWQPKHRIMETLPKMVENLKKDPDIWYKKNNLEK
jgi:nucleoside-diphosphate-sugar epimerase